jgi:hypothetical protein
VFHALKLYDSFSITDCEACLKVFNLESEIGVETFSININEVRSHLFSLSAKGNVLQNVDCMNTYLKRYLYLNMLNLVEDDEVDATAGKAAVSKDRNTKQTRLEKSVNRTAEAGATNPKLESYISKAESIHSPDEMNSFIASLKNEQLAPEEKHAIWNPITETAKLQGW